MPNGTPQPHIPYDKIYMQNVKIGVGYAKEKGYEMKRVVLAIRNRLVLEAVANALKRAGFFVEKSSSQEAYPYADERACGNNSCNGRYKVGRRHVRYANEHRA